VPAKYLAMYPDADPRANRTKYLAMVTCMDEATGAVLDRLASLGLERDTLVLFLGDNGGARPGDNGPVRGFKAQMFEGGLRVPFIARWPARIPAGRVTDEFLTALEVLPTLATATGAAPPEKVTLEGFDMLPVLEGRATPGAWRNKADQAPSPRGRRQRTEQGGPSSPLSMTRDYLITPSAHVGPGTPNCDCGAKCERANIAPRRCFFRERFLGPAVICPSNPKSCFGLPEC